MQLTCLGGAAAWPNPEQGCSSYLVRTSETAVLIDCGPDTLHVLRSQIRYSTIDAVVISHMHSDHMLDLVPYRYGLTYGVERSEASIPLLVPPAGSQRLDALASALGGNSEPGESFWEPAFAVEEYQPINGLVVGDIRIMFALTDHAEPCYAMRIESADGKSIFYTADTGTISPLLELAQGCDLLISEATMPDNETGSSGAGHLTPSVAAGIASRSGAGQLVLTHLWAERSDDVVLEQASRFYDGPIAIAKPGLRINV